VGSVERWRAAHGGGDGSAVAAVHVLGFVALLAFVAPGREHLGRPRR
jgi:hypothetical protein